MTQRANPSINRQIESFKTAGAIGYGGHSEGYVVPSSETTANAKQDSGIAESGLNAFAQSSSASSFDVTIDGGEAFVYGSWLAKDLQTTVTLASSTNGQTVYVGWDKTGTDDVIVGLSSDFSSASDDTDQKIPLWTFDTDGSGVTSVTDERRLGKTVDGSIEYTNSTKSSDYTTSGESVIFADVSTSAVTITLSDADTRSGNSINIIDVSGNADVNTITIDTESSQTIDGSSTEKIISNYGSLSLRCDGSNWYSSGSPVGIPNTSSGQQGGTVSSGGFVPLFTTSLADGESIDVLRATLTEDGFVTPADSGVDLVIADDQDEADPANASPTTILSGDGSTLYNDETGDPLAGYVNSSGNPRDIAIGIDNGFFGSGAGTSVTANASYTIVQG